ncbi:type II toxin-antitoxin system RelE/ParE family toxin [Flavobacterium psychrophilum]|jgi:phage-related protein|uniref:type II toxin-antitoxin system RelE/ParE family toxin n=1 Tax=Flavobacterium psychrophilum TaxID=96345 RepID=UPI001D08236B|nr:type II toxin-antitoxin system RelE/ParE family toxin [Flavobacterium psychrophilum]MCB6099675.1 type II toxin-antitoxin system RelE/ParE family toxin [Flavobacterium psychrophilum]
MEPKFNVEFLEEAVEFIESLDEKTKAKILYNIKLSQYKNDNELFKKLTDNIWEFRTLYKKTYYRFFAFWDKTNKQETLVISTHGIEKKTGKVPKNEILKAENLRTIYFEQ